MVTPLSIPNFATCGPNAKLSSDEGFEEVLENSKDEPVMKKRVSDSEEDGGGERETEAMGMRFLPLSDFLSWYNSLIVLHINFLSHKYSRRAQDCSRHHDAHSPHFYHTYSPHSYEAWYFSFSHIFFILYYEFIPLLRSSLANSCYTSCFFPSLTLVKVAPSSRFEVGSNSAIVPDPASEATAFFI